MEPLKICVSEIIHIGKITSSFACELVESPVTSKEVTFVNQFLEWGMMLANAPGYMLIGSHLETA